MLRADLYGDDDTGGDNEENENRFTYYSSGEAILVATVPLPSLNSAVLRLLDRLYRGIPLPRKPITEKHTPKEERNDLICKRYTEGESLESIGAAFRLSVQRVHQIIRHWCN